MISKLKTECGYQFTSKLEGMFTDMTMSKETMEAYLTRDLSLEEQGKEENNSSSTTSSLASSKVKLEVKVLTAAHWPASTIPQCHLPMEIKPCFKSFEAFYLQIHTVKPTQCCLISISKGYVFVVFFYLFIQLICCIKVFHIRFNLFYMYVFMY